jgi:hypothetical protein
MMIKENPKKQVDFFGKEAFTVKDRVLKACAFDSFMRWSGYMDYIINMEVFEEMEEEGLI